MKLATRTSTLRTNSVCPPGTDAANLALMADRERLRAPTALGERRAGEATGWPLATARSAAPRRAFLPALALLTLPLLASASPPEQPLDVQADKLTLDHAEGVARFTGHVSARQGAFELTCAEIKARYGEDGRLGDIVAEGGVTVTGEGMKAQAERATYDDKRGVLVLTGQPRLDRAGAWITGEIIRYWPRGGRVEIERARGQMKAPALARWGKATSKAPSKAPNQGGEGDQ